MTFRNGSFTHTVCIQIRRRTRTCGRPDRHSLIMDRDRTFEASTKRVNARTKKVRRDGWKRRILERAGVSKVATADGGFSATHVSRQGRRREGDIQTSGFSRSPPFVPHCRRLTRDAGNASSSTAESPAAKQNCMHRRASLHSPRGHVGCNAGAPGVPPPASFCTAWPQYSVGARR